MTVANHPHHPERKAPSPILAVVVLALIIILVAGFPYFRPKPQGAFDQQSSPAAAPK